jgi:hypothetical protein
MPRNLACRLARAEMLVPAISWVDRQAAQHRCSLRTRVKICDGIFEYLVANGIQTELEAIARCREEAEIQLAKFPDTPELRTADEAILSHGRNEEDAADALRAINNMLDQIAERMETGQRLEGPPNSARTS